jgi:succinate-semialdehyde dehydrogenase/glutarate-semialdehyde dehydrogenase
MMGTINPATGEEIGAYQEMSGREVEGILDAARAAFLMWQRSSFDDRAKRMRAAATVLREKAGDFAKRMAVEMGKPVSQGCSEVEKCAWTCDYYAEQAEDLLHPQDVKTDAGKSYVSFQPLGVLLAVMPWNFPFWQVFRAAVPAIMAGNVVVLKHASNVMGCAVEIEKVFRDAGFPDGVFGNLVIRGAEAFRLISHPKIDAVTFTGSVSVGKAIGAAAGGALKKCVLELGGSDPYVILEDANLGEAARICAAARLVNTGQSCIAAKRLIVVESVRREFEKELVRNMAGYRMGDPLAGDVQLGPLARHDLREDLHAQVLASIEKGAVLLLGGRIPEGRGAYYPATVLSDVQKKMPVFDDETFGPVAAVVSARDEKNALELANDSVYGLGAAVFTKATERGERIARENLAAGLCFVNADVRSDPRLPFGGIKYSGFGRELGAFGIREFVNIKTVWIK